MKLYAQDAFINTRNKRKMTTNDMDMLEILKGERDGRYHCAWCGERCLTYCSLCPDEPPIHIRHHNRTGRSEMKCFLQHHSFNHIGLGHDDFDQCKRRFWREPRPQDVDANAKRNQVIVEQGRGGMGRGESAAV
uniref:Uncharacterized protein n=1 Tax=Aplanochytrium stocchinoi TaxID=215587 RepID=A0A7S3LLR6_9STRA